MRIVNIIAETGALRKNHNDQSYGQVEVEELLALLEIYCDPPKPLSAPNKSRVTTGLNTPIDSLTRGIEPSEFL